MILESSNITILSELNLKYQFTIPHYNSSPIDI